MSRPTPADLATRLNRRPGRRLASGLARIAGRLAGGEGSSRLPPPLARRLRAFARRTPPLIVDAPPIPRPDGRRVLLVSNDLSRSGAPNLLVEIARMLSAQGAAVTVASPQDGPLRDRLVSEGVAVIVHGALLDERSPLLEALVPALDTVLCNTVVTEPAVSRLATRLPLVWYVHEVSLLAERLAGDPATRRALALPSRLWAGSELPAAILRSVRRDVEVVPYGLEPITGGTARAVAADRPLRIVAPASIEFRKGQDLLVAAVERLTQTERQAIRVAIYGRTLDATFGEALRGRAATLPEVSIHDALDDTRYRAMLLESDAVILPSRDDTLPLVSLDALGAGRVLICTSTTGTAAYLEDGVSGFVAPEPTPAAIAATLARAIAQAREWPAIAQAGRNVFDGVFSKAVFAGRLHDTLEAIAC